MSIVNPSSPLYLQTLVSSSGGGGPEVCLNGKSWERTVTSQSIYRFGLNVDTTATILMWAYFDSIASFEKRSLEIHQGGASDLGFAITTSGAIRIYQESGGYSSTSSSGLVSTGNWNLFSFVKNGNSHKLLLNGVSVVTGTSTTNQNLSGRGVCYFGPRDNTQNAYKPIGYCTNISLFDTIVSDADILAYYEAGTEPPDTKKAFYIFEDNLNDSSGNSQTLTQFGTAAYNSAMPDCAPR